MVKVSMPINAFSKKAYIIKLSNNVWVADNNGAYIQVDNKKFALVFFDKDIAESELQGFKDLYYPDYQNSKIEEII